MNDENWVTQKLSSLEPPQSWRPDRAAAMRALQNRRARHTRRLRLIWGAIAAGTLFATLIGITAPRACAEPSGCKPVSQPGGGKLAAIPLAVPAAVPNQSQTAASASTATLTQGAPPETPKALPTAPNAAPSPKGAPAPGQKFKERGPANAPIVIEIYTDYQCSDCTYFFTNTLPPIASKYADRIRVIHRDFPLPKHQYARRAAHWANAAGLVGVYDAAVEQLFKTQADWKIDGSIEAQLALVFPPETMRKIRALALDEKRMERMIDPDVALGSSEAIHWTPTIVVMANSSRQILAPAPEAPEFEAILNKLLDKTSER